MRSSKIKKKLSTGQPILVTTLHLTDPSIYEMASLMGFDGLWMDMEHHGYSLETANQLMRAARVGSSDIIARPAKGEFMRMGRMLEAGAQGIMYPRCDNAEEAREVVRWAKFAPLGTRGIDSANPDNPYCMTPLEEYLQQANEQTFIIIQLEEPAALLHAEEIAQVEGVDVLMLGPADFSILSGVPGQMDHPKVLEAMQSIAVAAKSAGKAWGCTAASTEAAKRLLAMGAQVIFHNADLLMIKNALTIMQQDFIPLGFSFGD